MKQDRFLIGILAFIGVLILAALALFFIRSRQPTYRQDNTPQGVVYDYAVALQLHNYERAYSYLAYLPNRPSFDEFENTFTNNQIGTGNASLQVGDVTTLSNTEAWVSLSITQGGGGIFDRGYTHVDKAVVKYQYNAWKIILMPYPYWGFSWYQSIPTPVK